MTTQTLEDQVSELKLAVQHLTRKVQDLENSQKKNRVDRWMSAALAASLSDRKYSYHDIITIINRAIDNPALSPLKRGIHFTKERRGQKYQWKYKVCWPLFDSVLQGIEN